MDSKSVTPPGSEDRNARLLKLIERVTARRLDGEDLSDDSTIAAHPDLMPELAHKLRALRNAERAREVASDSTTLEPGARAADPAFAIEMGDAPADTFHGYEVKGEIGRGAMGVVYKAFQSATKREVAIKVMMEGPFAGPHDRVRFEREAQILGQLKHPNIVSVHDTGVASGRFYIVMDYIAGRPLDAHLAANGHSVRDKLQLFGRICDAVSAAHVRGIIHRDLKPTNIRIDTAGEPHVLDFGLAKMATDDDRARLSAHAMTMTGQFVGSLPWASPEQTERDPNKLDLRSDVYALGVILYQMLTGKFPYPIVGNIRDVVDNILRAEPTRPSTVGQHIDNDVETIVLKCLAKERERRYQSAIELARDVQHYLAGDLIEAKRDSSWYVLRKTLRRYRIPVAIGAVFFVMLVAFGITMSFMYNRAQREMRRTGQILSFLQETLFEASSQGLGPDATLADALGDVGKRVDEQFAEQPDVAAALHYTIGHAYDTLWKLEEAVTHLRTARSLYEQAYGPEHPETLKCAVLLGMVLGELRLPEAVEVQRQALELRRGIYGSEHPLVAESMAELAYTLWIAAVPRRFDEAERYYCKALMMFRRVHGPKHPDIARHKFALGAMFGILGRYDRAEALYRESLEMARELLPNEHQFVMEAEMAYADALVNLNRFDEAEALLRQQIDVAPRRFGRSSLPLMLRRMGSLHLARDDPATAQRWFDQSAAATCEHLAEMHSSDAEEMLGFANAFCSKLDPGAVRDYRAALLAIGNVTKQPTQTVELLTNFARLHTARGEHTRAEALLTDALNILKNSLPNRHAYMASVSRRLAGCLMSQQRFGEAEPLLTAAHPILRDIVGPDHPATKAAIRDLAALYQALGQPDRAAEYRSMVMNTD